MTNPVPPKLELVHINKDKPFTDTLAVAIGTKLEHASVIKLVRKYKDDFEEFGTLRFQIQKSGGKSTEFSELNEDQATYLITLFRNNDVVRGFKKRLVKEFRKAINEISRLKGQRKEPHWRLERNETAFANKWMNATLEEHRKALGKETRDVHFISENKLINSILSGEYKALNRNDLSEGQLHLQTELQRINALLISQGLSYAERKSALANRAALISQQNRITHG